MQTTTYTEFRKNLSHMMDNVASSHDPLLVTRGSNSPAVLISLEDYNSFIETMHLMSSTANARRLDAAINELRKGNGVERELIEE